LASLTITETWAGLRPTTPDKGPLLGKTKWKNLYLAGGYWRNGVLLAPKTGYLVAMTMSEKENELSEKDRALLEAFSWDRFTAPEKAAALAANSRYAASLYPVHTRSSSGISAAVGTELGSYSTARSAGAERAKDREALWSQASEYDAFENAATMGTRDGSAYHFPSKTKESKSTDNERYPTYYEGSPDALTVGSFEEDHDNPSIKLSNTSNKEGKKQEETTSSYINAAYEKIIANKAKTPAVFDRNIVRETRPDPGFRIYYEDEETGERIEVPPYTSPGDFMDLLKQRKQLEDETNESLSDLKINTQTEIDVNNVSVLNGAQDITSKMQPKRNNYDETTFDGYQDILQANARSSRAEELQAMREARKKNRIGHDQIDTTRIGVHDFSKDPID
jgi:FAD dependent oxidoreductase